MKTLQTRFLTETKNIEKCLKSTHALSAIKHRVLHWIIATINKIYEENRFKIVG